MRLRSPFWCHHSKKPVQGFEQGLNKVSSFQAVPTQEPPTHAYHRWAGFGLVQAFWHKGQAAVMEELPLNSKQSRSFQTGSPNLMSRQMFFAQSDSCGVRTHALMEWRVEPPP